MVAAVLASFLYVFSVDAAAQPHLLVNVALALVALIVGGGGRLVGRQKGRHDRDAADGGDL